MTAVPTALPAPSTPRVPGFSSGAPGLDEHARAVFASFDDAYTRFWGNPIGKFWTERYAPGAAAYANLHTARDRRVAELCPGGEALLDIGAGYGDLLYLLRDKYRVLRGVDPSVQSCEMAAHNLASRGVRNDVAFTQALGESLPFGDGTFDTALMLDVYEHIEPAFRHRSLREAYRVLKPGGSLILVTPSLGRLRFWALIDNLLMLRRQLYLKRRHNRPVELLRLIRKEYCEEFLGSRELKRDIRGAGFRLSRFERVGFYPAPERGGFFYPYLEKLPADHPRVRLSVAVVNAFERLRFLNQKMLAVCTRPA